MPTLHRVGAVSVRMYADDHRPPHFHIVAPDFQVLVRISDLTVIAGDARPAEVIAWANEGGELRLRPRTQSLSRFAPVAWGLSPDNRITAIEYASTDLFPPIVMSFVNSKGFPEFRAKMLGKLQMSPLGPYAGISISPAVFSNFFTSAGVASGQVYEETFDELSNSARIVPRADKFEGWSLMGTKDVITTMWSIRDGKLQMLAGCGGCCKVVDGPC